MEETKFTPKPWKTNYTGNIWGDIDNPEHNGDSPLIAQIFKGDFEPQKSFPLDEEQKANAHLIASAPDMHEELEITLECLKGFIEVNGSTPSLEERIEFIEKTLAKARGE